MKTLPELEVIEPFFDREDFDVFVQEWPKLGQIRNERQRNAEGLKILRDMWPNELEFLANTVWLMDKTPRKTLLRPNYFQQRLYEDVVVHCRSRGLPIRAIILKGRQMGCSAFIQALFWVWGMLRPFHQSMTINYDDESTENLFRKILFSQQEFWFPRHTQRSRARTLHYAEPHESLHEAVTAGKMAAGRSYTLHALHGSEPPYWPDAEMTMAGIGNSIPMKPDTAIFLESTAQGARGYFYDAWCKAEDGESGYVPFFAPWFWDESYTLTFPSKDHERAFMRKLHGQDVEYMRRHRLTSGQMFWRNEKIRTDGRTLFQQEYPATAREAFLSTGSPVFDLEHVLRLEASCSPPLWQGEILLEHAPDPATAALGTAPDLE